MDWRKSFFFVLIIKKQNDGDIIVLQADTWCAKINFSFLFFDMSWKRNVFFGGGGVRQADDDNHLGCNNNLSTITNNQNIKKDTRVGGVDLCVTVVNTTHQEKKKKKFFFYFKNLETNHTTLAV